MDGWMDGFVASPLSLQYISFLHAHYGLLIVFTSFRCWLWVDNLILCIGPLTQHWPLAPTRCLTRVTCCCKKLREIFLKSVSENCICLFCFIWFSIHLCQSGSASVSLSGSLSVSLYFCLSACWCRAGQVSVIQGCKPEEDWIYL